MAQKEGHKGKDLNRHNSLLPHHRDHLLAEGFTEQQIDKWIGQGLRSLSQEEAIALGFKTWVDGQWQTGSGIYFPFTPTFGQLRLDEPITRDNGSTAKYLTPYKQKTQAYLPDGCGVVTEGIKDAKAGTWFGKIDTGAIAGVSHYRKALPEKSGLTIVFDSDGRINPFVFRNLFNAGLWVNGKIQFIPKIVGQPKAGLCEYFKAGRTAEDYKKLIASAYKPKELLLLWPQFWADLPDKWLEAAIKTAIALAAKHLSKIEQETLVKRIKKATGVSTETIRSMLQNEIAKIRRIRREKDPNDSKYQNHKEARYLPFARMLRLDFEKCVTATTFDNWVYENVFDCGGDTWMVKSDSFWKYEGNGAWAHVPDAEIDKKIVEASRNTYRLKYKKDEGWIVEYPYASNYHVTSATKFCRKGLLPENLPNNSHLVAFKNCTVDMRTGEIMPHSPLHRIDRYIDHEYKPGAAIPEVFKKFIESAYGLDLLPIIRAFTSMFIDPTAPYGKFAYLIGDSGTGKGTLGRLWNNIYGETRSVSLSAFGEISSPEGRHQYLTGKSICGFADIGGHQKGLRAFYELVDNGRMAGRALYSSKSDQIAWNCRFWVASVDFVSVENAGDGFKRRAFFIPTKGIEPKKLNPNLDKDLKAELADIISWALAMPKEERNAILLNKTDNPRIKEAIRNSELHADSAKVFVDMCLRPTKNERAFISKTEIHSRYVNFCKAFGYLPLSFTKFNNHLTTFLRKNHKKRAWTPMVNGHRDRIPAHWGYLKFLSGAFENISDSNNGHQSSSEPDWACIKSQCQEGGLIEIEEFWNRPEPPPPDDNSDLNGGGNVPARPPAPTNPPLGQVLNGNGASPTGNEPQNAMSDGLALNGHNGNASSARTIEQLQDSEGSIANLPASPPVANGAVTDRINLSSDLSKSPFPPEITALLGKRVRLLRNDKTATIVEIKPSAISKRTCLMIEIDCEVKGVIIPSLGDDLIFEDGSHLPPLNKPDPATKAERQPAAATPSPPSSEPDWSSFPHLTSSDPRAAQNRAEAIKKAILTLTLAEGAEALYARFRGGEIDWVEKNYVNAPAHDALCGTIKVGKKVAPPAALQNGT